MADLSELLPRVKYELVGQIVATVLGAALILFLVRLLGPQRYGLLFLAVSILGFTKIFCEAGVANSGARYVAEYKERAPEQIPHILRTSLLYNLGTLAVVAVVLIAGHQHIAALFDGTELASLLLYGVLFVVFGTLTTYTRITLQGFEAIRLSASIHALNILGRFVVAIGLVILGYGVWGALTGYILGFALGSLLGLVALYLWFYRGWETGVSIETGLRKRMAEYTMPLTATSTAKALDLHIDTILVGFFLNPVSVGLYVLAKQISQFLETPVYALGFSLAPTYGAEKARDNIQAAADLYETSLEYSLLVYIPAAAGLVLVAEPTIRYIFGSEYLGAVAVLQILAIYVIFRSLTTITENGLDYLGRARSRAIIKVVTVVLNIFLSILLIPRVGIIGAAIATTISYGLFSIATMYIVFSELRLGVSVLYKKLFNIVLITGVMCLSIFLVIDFITGLFSLVAIVVFGILVWGMVSIGLGMIDIDILEDYKL